MPKMFFSNHAANDELDKLAVNETVVILGVRFIVCIGELGKCFKRTKEQKFEETRIKDERNFVSSRNNSKNSKSVSG